MKVITTILWVCIILLAGLIVVRFLEREPLPNSVGNVKEILTEKTLPALESTSKDIFPEQRQSDPNTSIQSEKF